MVSLQARITQESESVAVKTISPEHRALIYELNTCVLGGVYTDPSLASLSLEFVSTINGNSLTVKLLNPVLFKLSRTIDDEGFFVIGEAELTPVEDGGKKILSCLDYCFKAEDGTAFSYDPRSLIYFRVEGDVCIDAVAESYELHQEVKPGES